MGYLGLCKVQPGKPRNLHSLSQFSAMISVINTQILLSTFFVRHCARNFSNYIATSNLQNIAYIDIYIYIKFIAIPCIYINGLSLHMKELNDFLKVK